MFHLSLKWSCHKHIQNVNYCHRERDKYALENKYEALVKESQSFCLGQQPLRYYICSGLNPNTHLQTKQHQSKLLFRLISFLIHLVLGLRILVFKIRGKKLVQPVLSSIAASKNVIISMIENKSLTDLTTSFCIIAILLLSMLPSNLVNEMDPVETGTFPNYIYVYFLHLLMPVLMAGLVILIYYLRNQHLRKTISVEIHDFVALLF